MKMKQYIIISSRLICLVVFLIFLGSVGLLYSYKEGQRPLPVFVLDYLGKQEAKALRGVVLSGSDSQLADEATYSIAMELYGLMQEQTEGELKGHTFSSIAEAKKVVQCLGYEILNGAAPVFSYYMTEDGKYHLYYEYGTEAAEQHKEATAYIDNLYASIECQVNSLTTEGEKAAFIADFICNSVVENYDSTLKNRTIYQLMTSEEKTGVCTVYTTLFDRFCEKAGIHESYIVLGVSKGDDSELHCWNKLIFSDGSIHYYDVTNYGSRYSKSLIDFDINYLYESFCYREVLFEEFGYRVGVNYVVEIQ